VSPPPIVVTGGVLNAFTRLGSGTLLAAGIDGVRNVIFRSTNGGMTFTELDGPLVRGLGQRNGVAYASSNDDVVNVPDSFALAQSTDDGLTFKPILHFADLQAISTCAKTICQDDCELKVNLGIWDENVCTATAMPRPVDGGTTGAGGQSGVDGGKPPVKGTGLFGCSCAAGGSGAGLGGAIGVALFLLLALSRGPARRRRL
jgi:hypothetical protein